MEAMLLAPADAAGAAVYRELRVSVVVQTSFGFRHAFSLSWTYLRELGRF